MTPTTAKELFVFAGAGISVPPPSNLRQFAEIRDEALTQIGLEGLHDLAADMLPEPFLQALFGHVDIVTWLRELLGTGSPNAVHYALAALSRSGAAVWTVNFDELIERVGGSEVAKPHGTLSGPMVFTSDDVLRGLSPEWEALLRARVAGRTAVFIGYSGNDLDFRPVWDDVLRSADHVVWYVFGTDDASTRASAARYLRGLLPSAMAAGKLTIEVSINPGRHLIDWLVRQGIVSDITSWPIDELGDRTTLSAAPALRGDLDAAAAEVLSIVGAVTEAKAKHWRRIRHGRDVRRSIGRYVALTINHGGSGVARSLWIANLIPPIGRLAEMRDRYLRKRVTIHSNLGHHRTVLRLTRRIPSYATATRAVVRLGSLKYVGDLRDSIDLGKTTTTRAARQPHAILAANAAFQTTQAMVWSGQIVEARHYLDEVLRPYAQLASNRWLGWAEFLEGCLLIHEQAPPTNDPVDDQALHALLRAYRRFDAERLNDGRVSATLAALTRLRQIGDDTGYRQQRVLLASLIDDRVDTYYARGHPTTRAAAAIEDADFSWFHESDVAEAEHLYRTAVALGVPLQRAAAQTQLASLEHHLGRPEAAKTADSARAEAERIGAIGLVERAEATARGIAANDLTIGELFFP